MRPALVKSAVRNGLVRRGLELATIASNNLLCWWYARAIYTHNPGGIAVTEDGFIATIRFCHARSRGWLAIVVNLRLRYHVTHAIGSLYFADYAWGDYACAGVF